MPTSIILKCCVAFRFVYIGKSIVVFTACHCSGILDEKYVTNLCFERDMAVDTVNKEIRKTFKGRTVKLHIHVLWGLGCHM